MRCLRGALLVFSSKVVEFSLLFSFEFSLYNHHHSVMGWIPSRRWDASDQADVWGLLGWWAGIVQCDRAVRSGG